MGISISQPVAHIDWSYTPKIVGFKRLWGGYNWMPNQMLKAGLSVQDVINVVSANDAKEVYGSYYFVYDSLWGSWVVGYSTPMVLLDPETGQLRSFQSKPTATPAARISDLNGRYPGTQTSYNSPGTVTADFFAVYDIIYGDKIVPPLTQDDLNGINEVINDVTGYYGTKWYVDFTEAVSPLANYLFIGWLWANGTSKSNKYATYEVMFKTILQLDPWEPST